MGRGERARRRETARWTGRASSVGLQARQTIPARELEVRIRERIPDVSVFCTNCTSSSPSGWEEYRKAIAEGLWPDDAG